MSYKKNSGSYKFKTVSFTNLRETLTIGYFCEFLFEQSSVAVMGKLCIAITLYWKASRKTCQQKTLAYYILAFYCSLYCATTITSLPQKRSSKNYPLTVCKRVCGVSVYKTNPIYTHKYTYKITYMPTQFKRNTY